MYLKPLKFFVIIALLVSSSVVISSQTEENERVYLTLIKSRKCLQALRHLKTWTLQSKDTTLIEINLFRIHEQIQYPQLYTEGYAIFRSIEKKSEVIENYFLNDRLKIFVIDLLIKMGRFSKAKMMSKKLHYLSFSILGPLNLNFEKLSENFSATNYFVGKNKLFPGKRYPISWFHSSPDRVGSHKIHEINPDSKNCSYGFYKEIDIPVANFYYLILGKTGRTDIWLDGVKIFSNKSAHMFATDQYFIRVFLSKGAHKLFIIEEDNNGKITLSLRTAVSTMGSPGKARLPGNQLNRKQDGATTAFYFPPLQKLLYSKSLTPQLKFRIGYLLFMSGLSGPNHHLSEKYSTAVSIDNAYSSLTLYYQGLQERNSFKSEKLFKRAIKQDQDSALSLIEIIKIKISQKLFYRAFELINQLDQLPINQFESRILLGELLLARGWILEARRIANELKQSPFPSSGYELSARIYLLTNDYFHSAQDYSYLHRHNRGSKLYIWELIKCYREMGQIHEALNLIHQAIALYPSTVKFRIVASKINEYSNGTGSGLPYLISALQISPYNAEILKLLGITYHKLDKRKLALYYLKRSLKYTPVEERKTDYLHFIINKK